MLVECKFQRMSLLSPKMPDAIVVTKTLLNISPFIQSKRFLELVLMGTFLKKNLIDVFDFSFKYVLFVFICFVCFFGILCVLLASSSLSNSRRPLLKPTFFHFNFSRCRTLGYLLETTFGCTTGWTRITIR